MTFSLGVAQGKVSGTALVIGPDGKVKGEIQFNGETDLSEEELRQRLNLQKPGDPTNGSDPRNCGA